MLYTLNGTITPARLSPAYRLGLFFTALAMLVLPLIYIGLIAAVGYGVWWHLSSDAWLLTARSGGIWRAVAYFGPAIAGLILMFFMVKPILARPANRMDPVPVWPGQQPVLFQFVNEICRQVGAPAPDRIQVDCQVNASASFASPPWGLRRPPLVLTIGLPLGAGLSVRQFGGVLAHEFGHFAQGGGMRLTFIVRFISNWFARVVHERDEWDERLQEWSERGSHGAVVVTMALARTSVWCSRQALSLLRMAGHAISCFMLRQMEYDADSYEIKIVGSRAFISTSTRMRELAVGAQIGYVDLQAAWVRRTLPSNLPAFLLERIGRVPREVIESAGHRAVDEKTGIFDTHPCDADRIRAAERAADRGILDGGDEPASRLFTDFEALSAAATRHHYEHDLGLPLSQATLLDTASAIAAIDHRDASQRAAAAFFHGGVTVLRPIDVATLAADAADIPRALAHARDAMNAMSGTISERYRRYESLQRTRDLAATARAFLESGYSRLVPQEFDLTEATTEDAENTLARAAAQQQELEPVLAQFEAAAARRLGCALAITDRMGTGANRVEASAAGRECERHDEAAPLIETVAALAAIWPDLIEMYHVAFTMGMVAPATAAYNENPQARSVTLGRLEARMGKHWRSIRSRLEHVAAGAGSAQTLAAAIGMDTDTCADPSRAAAVLQRAATLRWDLITRLAAIALRAEEAADATKA